MINIRKFDLNLLIALDVLLEEKNVSRAAERLALTQPTVSGMLSRLREALGDQLLVRTRHGMIATPRAESLRLDLKRVLRDLQQVIEPEAFDPGSAEFALTVSINDFMQQTVLVPCLSALKKRAPLMRLAIVSLEISEADARMARGEIDLTITTPEFAPQNAPRLSLRRDRYVGVVRKGHPLRTKRVSLKRFLSYEHVLVSPSGGSFQGVTDVALKAQGESRRVAISVPNFLVVPDVLDSGDFVAVVPEQLARSWGDRVRRFAPPIDVPDFATIAAWHPRSESDPAHVWFRTELRNALKGRA